MLFGGRPYDGHAVSYLSLSVVKMGILGVSKLICNSICKVLKRSKGFFSLELEQAPSWLLKAVKSRYNPTKITLKSTLHTSA